jgi:uncharacterized protein (DUF58 family)
MWSKHVIVIALLGLFLISLGIWMYNFGFLFAGMFIISFIVVTKVFFSPRRSRRQKLVAKRVIPKHRIMEDDIVPMEMTIEANDMTQMVELYEELPYYTDIYEGSNDFFHAFVPGEKKRYNFRMLAPMRGHFEMGPMKARHSDYSFL